MKNGQRKIVHRNATGNRISIAPLVPWRNATAKVAERRAESREQRADERSGSAKRENSIAKTLVILACRRSDDEKLLNAVNLARRVKTRRGR